MKHNSHSAVNQWKCADRGGYRIYERGGGTILNAAGGSA